MGKDRVRLRASTSFNRTEVRLLEQMLRLIAAGDAEVLFRLSRADGFACISRKVMGLRRGIDRLAANGVLDTDRVTSLDETARKRAAGRDLAHGVRAEFVALVYSGHTHKEARAMIAAARGITYNHVGRLTASKVVAKLFDRPVTEAAE